MNKEIVGAVNDVIARQISNSIPELEISLFSCHGWEWKTKEGESAEWHETPLDALIDFVYDLAQQSAVFHVVVGVVEDADQKCATFPGLATERS